MFANLAVQFGAIRSDGFGPWSGAAIRGTTHWPMVAKRSARRKKKALTLGPSHQKSGGPWVLVALAALVLVNLYVFVWNKNTSVKAIKAKAESATPALNLPPGAIAPANNGGNRLVVPGAPGLVGSGAPLPAATAPALITNGSGTAANPTVTVPPRAVVEEKVQKGDSLGRVLRRGGLAPVEADEVIRALAGVMDFKAIRPGQTYRIERGSDGKVRYFELILSKVQKVTACRDAQGVLVGKDDQTQTRIEVKAIGGRIDSSLYAAIRDAGEDPALVAFFVDVFAYDIDFYNDTHEGDEFRVVVEKEYKDQEFLRFKRILAAQYNGRAGTFSVYHHNSSGKGDHYYTDKAESVEKSFLKTPLKFARMSSGFNRKRLHPVLHRVKAHLGVDYAAPTGTPVWSAAAGTVVHRAKSGGAGNLVTIRHDNGLETLYMHLSKFANIKVGDHIPAKTVIGYVGATGLASGPHLHFGVKKHGEFVDPAKLEPTRGAPVPASTRGQFLADVQKFGKLLSSVSIVTNAAPNTTAAREVPRGTAALVPGGSAPPLLPAQGPATRL